LKREKMDIIHHICPVFINKVTFNPLALLGVTRRYPFVIGPVGREFNVADTRRSLLSWSNEASLIRKLDATLHYTEATVLARTGLSDKTLESCDALIAPTAESRNFWARLLDPKKIRMIPLGVDDRLFIPKNRDGRGRAIRLLAVGALTRRKGVDYLIKAFKRVADEDERVSLTISGEGPEKKNLLRLVEDLRISDRVTFRGLLRSRSRLVERYQSCDIFCHPALLETYGMVVLEAMACGKPVVVTKGCGVAEFVRHGEDGLLVPPGDVDALADAIIRLVGDEDLRKEMGGRVRRSVERDLSWRAVADKYYQVYSELANA
ncbi:MAG: glycosyltransferase family 4 protein, partial [Candidatus Bathyarchaeia archaeon]